MRRRFRVSFGMLTLWLGAGAALAALAVYVVIGLQRVGGVSLTGHAWLAAALGTIVTVAIGGGLMALVFHSARNGYDEGPFEP